MKGKEQKPAEQLEGQKETVRAESLHLEVEVFEERSAPMPIWIPGS